MKKTKNIGIDVAMPKKSCTDLHCPFHSKVSLRGRIFEGTIIKKDISHTAIVEWPRLYYLKKYERFEKRRTRLKVHNPPCVNAEIGDKVRIIETKPISNTKSFVIIEKHETS